MRNICNSLIDFYIKIQDMFIKSYNFAWNSLDFFYTFLLINDPIVSSSNTWLKFLYLLLEIFEKKIHQTCHMLCLFINYSPKCAKNSFAEVETFAYNFKHFFFNWNVKPHCLTRINKIFHILCALTSPSHYNRFEIVKGIIDIFYELLSYFSNQASTRCNALHGYKTCFIVEVLLQVTVARFRRHIFYEFHG